MRKLIVLFALILSVSAFAQSNKAYNYAEIIVIQKVDKNESAVKEIYLNSSTDTTLDKSAIAKLENTALLFKFMNELQWEITNTIYSQPSNSGPIWIRYIFKKEE